MSHQACSHDHSHNHQHDDDLDAWDDMMDPCCQKDKIQSLRAEKRREILTHHDITRQAMQKRDLRSSVINPQDLPPAHGDYPALLEARRRATGGDTPGYEEDEAGESDSELEEMMAGFDQQSLAPLHQLARLNRLGYGLHHEIHHTQLSSVVPQYPFVVCHFCSPSSALDAEIDLHLEASAAKNLGTRFVRLHTTLDSLCAAQYKLKEQSMIMAFRDGDCKASTRSLKQFKGSDGVEPHALDLWLKGTGVLEADPLPEGRLRALESGKQGAASVSALQDFKEQLQKDAEEEEEEEEESFYDCGLSGCKKPFVHNHFTGRV
ncbi:unnamed protein product, partial [Chrysoparadoxa australica]